MAPPAGRHRRSVPPRPTAARIWTAVAVLCATVGIGAVLPVVFPVDPNWSPFSSELQHAPAVRAAEPPPAEPLPGSRPVSVSIGALDARSEVVPLGLDDDGSMEVPQGAHLAGWYEQSPTPGELGPSVLAAHVDWADEPGVFADLGGLEIGDEITVLREDGSVATFRVDRVESYPKAEFPSDAVYGDIDHAGLRLITCGGSFDEETGDYEENVVVFAELAG
jgi:Sortase domain